MIRDTKVAICKAARDQYSDAPFSPSRHYPEYKLDDISSDGSVYEALRETLRMLELDKSHFDMPDWNPFGEFIKPGDKVVVKPNLVLDFNATGQTTDCLVTHASVLRPIIDYVLIALRGMGNVLIADSPHGNANFEKIKVVTRLNDLQEFYVKNGIHLNILDVRKYEYGHGEDGFLEMRTLVERDPEGYAEIDLGQSSAFVDLPHLENLYGADFDRSEVTRYHTGIMNKYLVARTFLDADVIINVPKLKTHKKIGTTLNVKSLIGINGDKNYLPHFRIGDPSHGGDEYPPSSNRFQHGMKRVVRATVEALMGNNQHKYTGLYKVIRSIYGKTHIRVAPASGGCSELGAGNWYGNDTVYRTVYDLSKILFLADKNGAMHKSPQRRFFSIIDGIIAGEKQGPLEPSPKPCGVLIGGFDPVATDLVATRLMGFNTEHMVVFSRLYTLPFNHPLQPISPEDIRIISNNETWNGNIFDSKDRYLALTPHDGWIDYLEVF